MRYLRLFLALTLASAVPAPAAELRLSSLFGDHMVLQRETTAPVWGWTRPGTDVSVSADWMAAPVTARADEAGRFLVTLATGAAGGPHSIRVEGGGDTIALEDVWLGEVWIAGGQSNMEWPLAWVEDGAAMIAGSDRSGIRFFQVAHTVARAPAANVDGRWQVASAATVGDFSAVAYAFGEELGRRLRVPVGLIAATWTGTSAKSWASEACLRPFGDFDPALDRIADERRQARSVPDPPDVLRSWWARLETQKDGSRLSWSSPGLDDGAWTERSQPVAPAHEPGAFTGALWLRRTVEIPEAWEGKTLEVDLGSIDAMDTTWFQGVRIGAHEVPSERFDPRHYVVPSEIVHAGRAVIAVRVIDLLGAGGFAGDADALRLHPADGAGDPGMSLAGLWRIKEGTPQREFRRPGGDEWFNEHVPTALFNGMIAPLVPYAMRGVVWYQGESNVRRADQYAWLFPALIADWRRQFGRGAFPFYYVQIAPYRYDDGDAGALRDAQRRALATPKTGMVVTLDIGDPANMHPRNKREVGRRLALLALARSYGLSGIVDSGPLYRSREIEGDRVRIRFDDAEGGLEARGGPLTQFEIAGDDGRWVPAEASIDGETVLVSSAAVHVPRRVRFAWAPDAEPNLFNAAGLPASTFRTD